MRTVTAIVIWYLLVGVAGCQSQSAEQVKTLRLEKKHLAEQVEQFKSDNEQMKERLGALSGLEPGVEPEKIYDLEKIKITRYTGFYDKDKDGRKEKLIVYIQPIDRQGDVVKAAGAADVELWDLNKKNGEALLGRWRVEVKEMKKLWFATVLIINYRLTFDIADKVKDFDEPLVVKVTFTDYLSGRVFKEQKVLKPESN